MGYTIVVHPPSQLSLLGPRKHPQRQGRSHRAAIECPPDPTLLPAPTAPPGVTAGAQAPAEGRSRQPLDALPAAGSRVLLRELQQVPAQLWEVSLWIHTHRPRWRAAGTWERTAAHVGASSKRDCASLHSLRGHSRPLQYLQRPLAAGVGSPDS